MMANLVIRVTEAVIANPGTISVSIQVTWTDAIGFNRAAGTDVTVSATAAAAAINEAIRSAGVALAAGDPHGVTVGPGDVVRVFGGAQPNVS